MNAINLFFVSYTIVCRPFTTLYSYIVCCVNELITEVALFSGMVIGVYDFVGNQDFEQRLKLGWIIIFANLILLYWVIATGVLRLVGTGIYNYWQKRKMNKIHVFQE